MEETLRNADCPGRPDFPAVALVGPETDWTRLAADPEAPVPETVLGRLRQDPAARRALAEAFLAAEGRAAIREIFAGEGVRAVNRLADAVLRHGSAHPGPGERFPAAPLAPADPMCADGVPVFRGPPAEAERPPAWLALGWAPEEPTWLRFEVATAPTPAGGAFTARALGDLDCNGELSTFERVGTVEPDGTLRGGAGVYVRDDWP